MNSEDKHQIPDKIYKFIQEIYYNNDDNDIIKKIIIDKDIIETKLLSRKDMVIIMNEYIKKIKN